MTQQNTLRDNVFANLEDEIKNNGIIQIVSDINSYNGSLEAMIMDSNDEETLQMYFGSDVVQAIRAVEATDYKYSDDYVSYDGTNLNSKSEYEYEKSLCEDITKIANELINCYVHVSIDGRLENIVHLLVNEYAEEMATSDFLSELVDDYDHRMKDIEHINFDSMAGCEIEKELDKIDFSHYGVYDSLDDAIDALEDNCKLYLIDGQKYIVFDA